MNLDMNNIVQLMIATSLLSGKGFDMSNFMGGLTFDKLLGLQMLSNANLAGVFGNKEQTVDTDKLVELVKAIKSEDK